MVLFLDPTKHSLLIDITTDLSSHLEIVASAVTGLDDTMATGEAGDVDHAKTVHVTVAGTAALVEDLWS